MAAAAFLLVGLVGAAAPGLAALGAAAALAVALLAAERGLGSATPAGGR